jgi:heterodisulfide reductase subunit A-like polyferredoxin
MKICALAARCVPQFCEFKAIEMVKEGDKLHSHIISEVCKGCGVCAGTCPSGAITAGHFTDREILSQVEPEKQATHIYISFIRQNRLNTSGTGPLY